MIKKLRHKFVFITMSSLLAVIIVIISCINGFNFYQMNQRVNGILKMLSENDGNFPQMKKEKGKPMLQKPKPFFSVTAETPFETRYFFVKTNEQKSISQIDTGHIAAVSSTVAKEYAQKVLQGNQQSGYKGVYKYLVTEKPDGFLVLFVDCSQQIHTSISYLLVSGGVAVSILLVMFFLVSVFSKRAIRPIIENLEKQKQFITDAGHEIKTPLAIISANTDVLELNYGKNQWLHSTRNQTKRLNDLVKNLLELSKMEENNSTFVTKEFSLSHMVFDTVSPFQVLAKTKEKELKLDIKEEVSIKGNEDSIKQLLSILLDNAVKYTDKNGTINVRVEQSRKEICLEITNTCNPLPTGNLDKMFDRFYRLDSSRTRETGGYGIGLSIAKAIVEKHKGKISVYSKDENKISFLVCFPL